MSTIEDVRAATAKIRRGLFGQQTILIEYFDLVEGALGNGGLECPECARRRELGRARIQRMRERGVMRRASKNTRGPKKAAKNRKPRHAAA